MQVGLSLNMVSRKARSQDPYYSYCTYSYYINDLHWAIKNCRTYHFADDTNLLGIGKSLTKVQKQINIDLRLLVSWLLADKISLDKTKTELVISRRPKDKTVKNVKIKLNGLKLYPSCYIKYLGFLHDETLSDEVHICELLKKLIRANAMLTKTRHHILENQLVSLYYAIFSNHMLYGCQREGPQ